MNLEEKLPQHVGEKVERMFAAEIEKRQEIRDRAEERDKKILGLMKDLERDAMEGVLSTVELQNALKQIRLEYEETVRLWKQLGSDESWKGAALNAIDAGLGSSGR
jgi:hypothetical protein